MPQLVARGLTINIDRPMIVAVINQFQILRIHNARDF
jgi:hypothetical protein